MNSVSRLHESTSVFDALACHDPRKKKSFGNYYSGKNSLLSRSLRAAMHKAHGSDREHFYSDEMYDPQLQPAPQQPLTGSLITQPASRPNFPFQGQLFGMDESYCGAFPEYCAARHHHAPSHATPPSSHAAPERFYLPPQVNTQYVLLGVVLLEAAIIFSLLNNQRG